MITKLKYTICTITVSLFLYACTDFTDDLNQDPNNQVDADEGSLLTMAALGNMGVHEGEFSRIAGLWNGYFRGIARQSSAQWQYQVDAGTFSWNGIYQQTLAQSELVIEKATQNNNRVLAGVAKVIKANVMGTATQLFGDIPFTEAADINQFEDPRFDQQQEIYANLLALLDEASADLLSETGTVPLDADIHFNGDPEKWVKVANTLKARYHMDLADYSAAYTAALLGIDAPEASLMGPHESITGKANTYWVFNASGDLGTADQYLPQLLDQSAGNYRGNAKTNEEARFNYFFVETFQTTELEPNTMSTSQGQMFDGVFAMGADFPLVTYQENLLTLAEAALRNQDIAQALAHLNDFRALLNDGAYFSEGVNDAFDRQYDPYELADFEAGGIENTDNQSTADALLREILEERYITFYGQILGWSDERRNRDDAMGVKLTPNLGSQLPARFLIPQSEINANANIPSPLPGLFDRVPVY